MKSPQFDQELLTEITKYSGDEHNQNTPDPIPANASGSLSKRDQKKDKDLDRELKRKYGYSVLYITWIWLFVIIGILITSGISNLFHERQYLSDAILIALLSSTSLVSLATIILRYLFFRK